MKTKPVIDAHVHIFPPRMSARRDHLVQADPWFGEAFGHPKARMRSAEELIASMDAAGVDASVVVGWPWRSNELCAEHNDYLAVSVELWPERLVWLGIVNPVADGAMPEINRCIELGARGFGEINADGQGFHWSKPAPWTASMARIAEAGLPVMVHTSEPAGHRYPGKGTAHPDELLAAVDAVPGLRWVMAHWGGGLPFYELMPEVRAACMSVAYDSAATSFLYDPTIFCAVIDLVGIEKVVFGSDWPVLAQGKLLQIVRSLPLSDDERAMVLGQNAARIYAIGE